MRLWTRLPGHNQLRGTLWALHMRMRLPRLPLGAPDCSEEPRVQTEPRGVTLDGHMGFIHAGFGDTLEGGRMSKCRPGGAYLWL